MASFRSEAEAFSGMSGMVEGHARRATGLKPRALARGVGSFGINYVPNFVIGIGLAATGDFIFYDI